MNYSISHITKKLKATRQAKGLSQRKLSQLAGVPQSHISKIESGAVDLRVSSLIELARVLDLELTLVPRKALPAINSIVRSSEYSVKNTNGSTLLINKRLKEMEGTITELTRNNPANKGLAQIQRQTRDLQKFNISNSYLDAVKEANHALQLINMDVDNQGAIQSALSEVQDLRNSLAHSFKNPPEHELIRPLYSLDGNDDG